MKYKLLVVLAIVTHLLTAQQEHSLLRLGDQHYQRQDWANAEDSYRKAWMNKNNVQGGYNLGNAIYQQKRYDEAIRQYESLAQRADNDEMRQKAYHNLGNAHYQAQKYDQSIAAYKSALKINPHDVDTKMNLQLAQQQLKIQQQQQQQNNPPKEKNQEEQPQPSSNQEQKNQPTKGTENEQQSEQKTAMTKEQAEQLLQVINQEEQKVQQKLRKAAGKTTKPLKEW